MSVSDGSGHLIWAPYLRLAGRGRCTESKPGLLNTRELLCLATITQYFTDIHVCICGEMSLHMSMLSSQVKFCC